MRACVRACVCRFNLSKKEIAVLFSLFDLNGNGHLDYYEFIDVVLPQVEARHSARNTRVCHSGHGIDRGNTAVSSIRASLWGGRWSRCRVASFL